MRRPRRPADNRLSFLDVISCGFGAMVLLILITKNTVGEPVEDLQAQIEALQEQLARVMQVQAGLASERLKEQARARTQREKLQEDRKAVEEAQQANAGAKAQALIEANLKTALQSLNEEMRRLNLTASKPDVIGGIPADSEYIIFIVDTSGSMKRFAWQAAKQQLVALLDAYPKVRGLQVMNDMGSYMFSGYRGRWIPDTPARRKVLLQRFDSWHSYSNSSPVEGILEAIKRFRMKSDKISLYIFGDEYTGESIQEVIDTVDDLNHQDGKRQVRIHAVGFFTRTQIEKIDPKYADTTSRFAGLMRELTRRNGGTFLGVTVDESSERSAKRGLSKPAIILPGG